MDSSTLCDEFGNYIDPSLDQAEPSMRKLIVPTDHSDSQIELAVEESIVKWRHEEMDAQLLTDPVILPPALHDVDLSENLPACEFSPLRTPENTSGIGCDCLP